MSRPDAELLALSVRSAAAGAHVAVQPDDDDADWVIQVETASAGIFWPYDEDDWEWLRPQILDGMRAT